MKPRSLVAGLLIAVTTAASPVLPAVSAAQAAENALPAKAPEGIIIGGHDATDGYNFMASMQHADTGAHRCGAALVAPRWLVTAAHCLSGEDPAKYQYRIGSVNRTNGGELASSDAFVINPGYNLLEGHDDIALVRLSRPVNAAPAAIADAAPPTGSSARIIGWGLTCPVRGCGDPPVTLQELDMSVASQQSCTGITPFDPDHELCIGNNGGATGACFGDSGSPALVKAQGVWQVVGVTSRSQSFICALFPTIYTNVTSHTAWITQQIKGP